MSPAGKLIFSFCLLLWTATPGYSHNCSNVLTVESEGLLNYLVNVTFEAPHDFEGEWTIDLDTDVMYTFIGSWKLWVKDGQPEEGKTTLKSRESVSISQGDIITFRLRISWFRHEPKPEVVSMIWDGTQICEENGQTTQQIKSLRRRREDRTNGRLVTVGGRTRYRVNTGK